MKRDEEYAVGEAESTHVSEKMAATINLEMNIQTLLSMNFEQNLEQILLGPANEGRCSVGNTTSQGKVNGSAVNPHPPSVLAACRGG